METLALARMLVAALLALVPQSPAAPCLRARSESIAQAAAAAQNDRGVPAAILLSTGFQETWCGCHPNEGGGFGAPRDFHHRHIAGTADDAARVLQRGFERCHTWEGASIWFRSGLPCRSPNPIHRAYTSRVLRFATRLHERAGVPMPEHMR